LVYTILKFFYISGYEFVHYIWKFHRCTLWNAVLFHRIKVTLFCPKLDGFAKADGYRVWHQYFRQTTSQELWKMTRLHWCTLCHYQSLYPPCCAGISANVSKVSLFWLKCNNFVMNWWYFTKFCSTIMHPLLSEIQLKFLTVPCSWTHTTM